MLEEASKKGEGTNDGGGRRSEKHSNYYSWSGMACFSHHIFRRSSSLLNKSSSFSSKFGLNTLLPPQTRMATTGNVLQEVLPPALDSSSAPPPLFDGTTRLYISYTCPYAQRAWITRNCKGLQDKIKLVAIDLESRPAWYKEKLYPANKVPVLEYKNEVKGESLDLMKYLDSEFDGPALLPNDPAKREFAEELFSYTDTFSTDFIGAVKGNGDIGGPFDYLEKMLSKFDDGPFLLGQFSLADIAYAPFVQRYSPLLLDVIKYDIKTGRPKLTSWIEELHKISGYKQTIMDSEMLVGVLKKLLSLN